MKALLSFAAFLLIFGPGDGRQARAGPIGGVATLPIAGVERLERGPSFAANDLITETTAALSTPRFDQSAGFFASGGIQPAAVAPDNLSGGYTVPQAVREVSASVMVADGPGAADASPPAAGSAAPGGGTAPRGGTILGGGTAPRGGTTLGGGTASAGGTTLAGGTGSTVAAGSGYSVRESGAAGTGFGAVPATQSAMLTGSSGRLVRSSVFLDTAAGVPDDAAAHRGRSDPSRTASATLRGAASLTVYRALRDAATEPGASLASGRTIESYSIAKAASAGSAPATETVRMPLKIASNSYGFLNSSLTVFSDDFGSFAGIGQTFNGLTSLDIAEPASVLLLLASLAGLAATRPRRRP